MSAETTSSELAEPAVLDPFSFHAGSASRIAGLGGAARPPSNDYVFHTPYVPTAVGHAHFHLRFTGLKARRGTLQLRVHMLPDEPGAVARVANSARVSLNRLIKDGGGTSIRFEGFRGVRFALHGTISDDTDAVAEALIVTLDRPANPGDGDAPVEARSSAYGVNTTRASANIHALRSATLAHPVSQAFSPGQLDAPAARELAEKLGIADGGAVLHWSILFVIRALHAYGLAVSGAHGLWLGPIHAAAIEELLERGCTITVAAPEDRAAALRPHEQLHLVSADPALIGGDLVNFDFVCSTAPFAPLGSTPHAIELIERTIRAIRPGGFAIHVLPFVSRHVDPPPALVHLDRSGIEQLTLILISRGHDVAQLLLEGTGVSSERHQITTPSAYGIIARRAPSAF